MTTYSWKCGRCEAKSKQDAESFILGRPRQVTHPIYGVPMTGRGQIYLCDQCGCPRTLSYREVR